MPKEEDLNSWSHHYSTDTTDDPVFRGAMVRGLAYQPINKTLPRICCVRHVLS